MRGEDGVEVVDIYPLLIPELKFNFAKININNLEHILQIIYLLGHKSFVRFIFLRLGLVAVSIVLFGYI